MKASQFWHKIRMHEIKTFHSASGIVHHCSCGHYWIEDYE